VISISYATKKHNIFSLTLRLSVACQEIRFKEWAVGLQQHQCENRYTRCLEIIQLSMLIFH